MYTEPSVHFQFSFVKQDVNLKVKKQSSCLPAGSQDTG